MFFDKAVAAAAVCAITLFAAPSQAQMPGPMMVPGPAPMTPFTMPMGPVGQPGRPNPLAALGLSEEQRKQLEEIGSEARARNVKVMSDIGNQYEELRKLFAETTPDAKKIGGVYQTIFDLQRQAIEHTIEVYNRQVAVLNDEQQQKWNAMRQQMLARFLRQPPGQGTPAQ